MPSFIKSPLFSLLLIVPLPIIGVVLAAYSNLGTLGSLLYLGTKVWILIFPVACWVILQKNKIKFQRPSFQSILSGGLFGILFFAVIVISYFLLAHGKIDFSNMKQVLHDGGISSLKHYIFLTIGLTLINSLFEEYVFRWFIFEQLRKKYSAYLSIFITSLIFMIHHSVVLYAYIPWYFNVLVSVSILFAGIIWSYLYHKHQSIIPAYISHIFADVGVFVIGYFALFY